MSRIQLLPLGNADRDLVTGLVAPLQASLLVPVEVRRASIDLEQFYDESRGQYNSTSLIDVLQQNHTPPKVLAVVGEDLFIPILTYVFGEAELGGHAAVVSYHRLQNERYGLPPDSVLLFKRVYKESLHELGHVFGLIHCLSQDCVMHTSTYVEDIDIKGDAFCPDCRTHLERVR